MHNSSRYKVGPIFQSNFNSIGVVEFVNLLSNDQLLSGGKGCLVV